MVSGNASLFLQFDARASGGIAFFTEEPRHNLVSRFLKAVDKDFLKAFSENDKDLLNG
jgi:hypothetical protein